MYVSYFVFTSGEEGTSGLDWGVKFVSKVPNRKEWYAWDKKYRETLNIFGLPPDLKRPFNEAGLLVLPWPEPKKETNLVGFVFPYRDLSGRPNVSLVAALVPNNLYKSYTLADTVKKLWAQNPLEDIARRPGDRKTLTATRPGFLKLAPSEEKSSTPHPKFWDSRDFISLNWPQGNALLCVNGKIDVYDRKNQNIFEQTTAEANTYTPLQTRRGIKKYVILAAALLVLVAGGAMVCKSWWGSESGAISGDILQKEQSETTEEPSEAQFKAEDTIAKIKKKNNDNLNGLISVYRVDDKDKNTEVWKKTPGYPIPTISLSELENNMRVSNDITVVKNTFVADIAEMLQEKTRDKRVVPQKQNKKTTYVRVEMEMEELEYRNLFVKEIKKEISAHVKKLKSIPQSDTSETDVDVYNSLVKALKEDNGDPYVFVFQWTEEVDKFVVYDSNQQMLERYVLKPGWVPVKSSKIIEESLEKNIKCANEDGQVNIQYPHSLDVDRVLDGTLSHFKEFAKQLLEEIKD